MIQDRKSLNFVQEIILEMLNVARGNNQKNIASVKRIS